MTIYDRKLSLYDNLDCLESESVTEEIDPNDLNEAKNAASLMDDELRTIEEDLDTLYGKYQEDKITLEEIKDFFDSDLGELIEAVAKLRERLY